MASSAADRPFPVPLVCPSCASALVRDAACSCAAATRLEYWNGLPRILFGQRYRGEYSSEKMAEILRRMDAAPWKQVLREVVPDESLTTHLTANIGPDFVHGMPWDEIETALDVGAGMGFMTAPLARRGKTVVALEAVPERALFQRKRAAQDGFSNWHPLVAGAAALPFASGTFDLITLNGVFEYIGLWGEGDPETLQRRFLAEALRLLKPGGYLYVGIETRFALNAFLGGRDHSGLPYTSLMPRRLADWYCRKRSGNSCGSERAADGYRTYTYTPDQYGEMFSRAGFGRVDVFGVVDGYNHQKAVYRMDEPGPRRFTRELANPPSSWKGKLLRGLANVGPWSRTLEDEVVIFGRKEFKAGRLVWRGIPHDGSISQFSSGDKVFVLCFDGEPTSVFKGPKTDEAVVLLAKEYEFLRAAALRHGAESESWPLRWPKPLGVHEFVGRTFFRYEFAAGTLLSAQLKPVGFRLDRFGRLFNRLVEGYVDLCAKMTPATAGSASWYRLLDRLAAVPIGDPAVREKVGAACARLRSRKWTVQSTHGDLSLSNAMLLPAGGLALIDWENASVEGFAAIDLMRLLNDTLDEGGLLKPGPRRAAEDAARRIIRGAFRKLGIGAVDEEDVEALFVADQFRMWLSRDPSAATSPWALKFLERYARREFALTVSPASAKRVSAG